MTTAALKSLHLRIKSAGTPSDAQLSMIRKYTLADMTADQLYVRTFVLAHNAIDRDNEAIDDALLSDFARTLPGKGLFIKHPLGWDGDTGPGEGRWFDARVERMSLDAAREFLREPNLTLPPDRNDVSLLYADAYIARTSENDALLVKIDAGVVSDVSIGFNYAEIKRLVDGDGRELNAWRYLGPGEALEGSLVWLGAQPGARAVKNANRNPENPVNTATKSVQEQLDSAQSDLATATTALASANSTLDAIRAALTDDAALVDNPTELAALVRAGKDYRGELVDAIVAGERHRGLIGDTPEDVAAAKSAYAVLPASKLKVLAKSLGATAGGKSGSGGGIKPADPNTSAPGTKALSADSPLNNPLISGAASAASA